MKPSTKSYIKTFLLSGGIYGSLMAGYEYSQGNEFKPWHFIIHVLVFGLLMTFVLNKNKTTQEK